MGGILIILTLLFWGAIVFLVGGSIVRQIKATTFKTIIAYLFLLVIFISPVIDEIGGAITFQSECENLAPYTFYGPVSIGEGKFFDKDGNKKWNNDREFWQISVEKKEWDALFTTVESVSESSNPFFTISRYKITDVERKKKQPILVREMLSSQGGWLSREFDGFHSYSCISTGTIPREEQWIKF